MIHPHVHRAAQALLLLAALAVSTACSGGSGSGAVAGGGTGGGGQGPQFVWEDLNGDWIGQLVPAGAASQPHNAYLRWVDERLVESAESGGTEFLAASSSRRFQFSARGALSADLQALVGTAHLRLSGQMDETATLLEGSFQLTQADGGQTSGEFRFSRSAGAGQFAQDMLTKPWDGLGRNGSGKFRFLKFELDAAGSVVEGLMKHPQTELRIRDYSAGAGSLTFADTSVGRINDVILVSDQGFTLTFPFLLLDADGTLLAGAGLESELGSGVAELVPGL